MGVGGLVRTESDHVLIRHARLPLLGAAAERLRRGRPLVHGDARRGYRAGERLARELVLGAGGRGGESGAGCLVPLSGHGAGSTREYRVTRSVIWLGPGLLFLLCLFLPASLRWMRG